MSPEEQSDRFIDKFLEQGGSRAHRCEVHWFHPNEPERNSSFFLDKGEVWQYLDHMLGQGYLAGVRIFPSWRGPVAEMYFWEEWDGDTPFIDRMPKPKRQPTFEALWQGYA